MKKNYSNLFAAVCGLAILCSCSKDVMNLSETTDEGRLTVLTRTGEGTVIAMPVKLYVFNAGDECVAAETTSEESGTFSVSLPVGTYSVYAIGGADESRMVLPPKETATKTTALSLKTGQVLGDLMAGNSNVTVAPSGGNTVALTLERKVCLLTEVTIKNVPTTAGSVSVSISPFYESILLDGTNNGTGGSCTFSLTKQSDGTTWKCQDETYQLPSVGNPTITITIDGNSFTYTGEQPLTANHKISIEGTYVNSSITLNGTITGVEWEEPETITFTFDNSN